MDRRPSAAAPLRRRTRGLDAAAAIPYVSNVTLSRDAAQSRLLALHAEVDDRTSALTERHRARLQCRRGCASCCVDDLTVFEVEAERIRRAHPDLLARGEPHSRGACAFLDAEGACRIHADRPYVCRTQGLPLRWLDETGRWQDDTSDREIREQRDICPLNLEGPSLLELHEDECWLLGPVEERLGALQAEVDGGARRRVALRDLFARR